MVFERGKRHVLVEYYLNMRVLQGMTALGRPILEIFAFLRTIEGTHPYNVLQIASLNLYKGAGLMSKYQTGNIRNICLVGHGSAGKTTLAEAMLFLSGGIDRFGNVADGTTTTDYDPEEIKRGFTIGTAIAPVEWNQNKINVIDAPGYFDFVGGTLEGLRGSDNAVLVVSGRSGVSVGAEKSYAFAKEQGMPTSIFITKLDRETADMNKCISALKNSFGAAIVPFILPIMDGEKTVGLVDVIKQKGYKLDSGKLSDIAIPADMEGDISAARDTLFEQIAESDEVLMEKYFGGESFTDDEISKGIKTGIIGGSIIPVFGGELGKGGGVTLFMDAVCEYLPGPGDMGETVVKDIKTNSDIKLKPADDETLCAIVFKTVADPYVGKLSIFRVMSGCMKADTTVNNPTKEAAEKIGRIYLIKGKKQTETDSICAGDIGAVTKLVATSTGDTLCSVGKNIVLSGITYPKTVISLAVLPTAKGDEEKIHAGLIKLTEEDPTFRVTNNTETHQMLIEGQGEQHIDVITSKLKAKYGVNLKLEDPIVPYREAIRGTALVEGKHKKQSGGHGQYGHVKIQFEPGTTDGLEFLENVFGGSVPRNFFPAVEKGLRDSMPHGVLAGFPVVNLKATLLDGSYHPVDSSEMAFKVAAGMAFKTGLAQANPVLMEPIGHLKAVVPEAMMGDVIGDINKRRGRILGMGAGEVEAEVPMAEMFKYATDLRSMTQARGYFEFEFIRYDDAPHNVAQKVIEDFKARKAAEEK